MPKKVLQLIDTAYRCTVEEQDDPAVWITHAMKGAGGDLDVLLAGSAVNYAVKGQDATGLRFGERTQSHSPDLDGDIARLVEKGVSVFLVEDDAAERGIEPDDLIGGVKHVSRSGIAKLFGNYDQVWHW